MLNWLFGPKEVVMKSYEYDDSFFGLVNFKGKCEYVIEASKEIFYNPYTPSSNPGGWRCSYETTFGNSEPLLGSDPVVNAGLIFGTGLGLGLVFGLTAYHLFSSRDAKTENAKFEELDNNEASLRTNSLD